MRVRQELVAFGEEEEPKLQTVWEPETVEDVLELDVAFADDHPVILPMVLLNDICRRIKALEER